MFSPGIYNQQRSTYVGSPLGEFMQMLPQAQQRFDQSREMFDASDAFLDSVDVIPNEYERQEAMIATQPYREAIEKARQSGDYRLLYGDAGRLSKQVISDKRLETLQKSHNAMVAQKEMESKLGSQALVFSDPSKHRSVTYDDDGNPIYNVYVPDVEERMDWDKPKVDVMGILKADGYSLTPKQSSQLQGFIETGNFKGLTDTKIKNYISSAYDRYLTTPEGVQEMKALMKQGEDQGMGSAEAAEMATSTIIRELMSVGNGMVYSEVSRNYSANPFAKAGKTAKDELLGGYRNYSGADPTTGINFKKQFLGTSNPLKYEDGKIMSEFNWKEGWQDYKENQKAIEQVVPGGIGWLPRILNDFTTVAAHLVKSAMGSKSELKPNPRQEILFNTIKELTNPMSPESVGEEDLVEYINSVSNKPMVFVPIFEPKSEQVAEFKKVGINQQVDDPSKFQPNMMTNRKFYIDGKHVTYGTLTGSGGPVQNPISSFVTGTFGVDNAYGFAGGGEEMTFGMLDGSTVRVPMQFSEELDLRPENQIQNMIHETKYSAFATTYNERNIGGMPVIMTNTGGKIRLYDPNDSQNPIVTADFTSEEFRDFANGVQGFRTMQNIPAYSDEELQSAYIIKKLNER